jgi:hypothetical protein
VGVRLHGLITRIPHNNTYTLTLDGLRVAVSYNKVHARLMALITAADQPPARVEPRRALPEDLGDRHYITRSASSGRQMSTRRSLR